MNFGLNEKSLKGPITTTKLECFPYVPQAESVVSLRNVNAALPYRSIDMSRWK